MKVINREITISCTAIGILLITASALLADPSIEYLNKIAKPLPLDKFVLHTSGVVTFQRHCGTLQFEAKHLIAGRIFYALLQDDEKEKYKRMMAEQYRSNEIILKSLNERNAKQFCEGLEASVNSILATYITQNPSVFDKEK